MRHEEIMCKFFNFSAPTYYKRKKEGNLAIKFIEKYFSDENILEFLNFSKMNKLENLNSYSFSSCMSFLKKMQLQEFCGYKYFSEFILHYILKSFEPAPNGGEYWIGQRDQESFQKDFIEFLFRNYGLPQNVKNFFHFEILNDMKYLTMFIYSFDESDLLFLNMNIEDDFKTLKSFANSNTEFYSYDQKNTLIMFENSLLECLKRELNREGNLEDLISEYKLKCIKDLEGK